MNRLIKGLRPLSWQVLLSALVEEAIVVAPDYTIVYANAPVLKRLGLSLSDLMGQMCHRALYEDENPCQGVERECPVRTVLQTGRTATILHRETHGKGYRHYAEITAIPLAMPKGRVDAVICLRHELGLQERYKRIFDSIKEGVAVVSRSGRMVEVNAALCDMLGYTSEEMSQLEATDFVPLEFASSLLEPSPEDTYLEMSIPRKDGSQLQAELTISPLSLGPVTLFVAFVRDIGRRKEWEKTIAQQAEALSQSGALYQALFDSSGDALVVLEEDTTIAMVNRRFEEMTGYRRAEVVGKMSLLAMVPEEDRERVQGVQRTRLERPAEILPRHSNWILGKNGKRWLAEVSGSMIPGTQRSLLDLRDVTDAHRLQEEILQRNKELGALISVTREMVSTLDAQVVLDRTLAIVCRQISAAHGFLCLLNEETGELTASTFWGDVAPAPDRVWKVGDGVIGWVARNQQAILCDDIAVDPRVHGSHGPNRGYQSMVAAPLKVKDKLLGVVAAVSKEKASFTGAHLRLLSAYAAQASLALDNAVLYEEVKSQASTDELTRLYNRRFFDFRLDEELKRAQRYGHPLSLLFLDVDKLKVVNDEYGHLQGDLLLRHLASLLMKVFRSADTVARYGGDEFVVLLPETGQKAAATVAERLLQEANPCPLLSGGSIPWSMSVGVAWVPIDGDYNVSLLRLADEAAYRAKRDGTGWALATGK